MKVLGGIELGNLTFRPQPVDSIRTQPGSFSLPKSVARGEGVGGRGEKETEPCQNKQEYSNCTHQAEDVFTRTDFPHNFGK